MMSENIRMLYFVKDGYIVAFNIFPLKKKANVEAGNILLLFMQMRLLYALLR